MLRALSPPPDVTPDVRELVFQTRAMAAAHGSAQRPRPDEWQSAYSINEALAHPAPEWICIVDDLLVTGCRLRAMSNILRARFPDARLTGLFIARRVSESVDPSDFFEALD